MIKTKRDKVTYEECKPYQKYRRKSGWANSIKSLMPAFFSLAVLGVGLSITMQSLKSSGLLEDKSQSRTGISGGNNGGVK